jgi:hypothetical protein
MIYDRMMKLLILAPHCYAILWQSKNEKNELILWKLNSIQMKLLNDIAFNLNWIQILKFDSNIKRNLVLCNQKKKN